MSGQMNHQFETAPALCRQFDVDLPAYLEGEDRPAVTIHAQECGACGAVLAEIGLIRSEAGAVLLEDPPARLWANVRATLEAEGAFRQPVKGWLEWFPRFGMMHYAAPLAALGCLAIFGAFLLVSPSPSGPATPVSSAAVAAPPEQTVAAMETSYRAREKYLDPRLQASYQKGLQSLDKSIRECKDSVEREPANTLAREYLATAYEQKVAVLSAALEYDGR